MRRTFFALLVMVLAIVSAFAVTACFDDGGAGQSDGGQSNTEQSTDIESGSSESKEPTSSGSEYDENGGSWTTVVPFSD